eukprot:TRINITY_DN8503_c0_g1_i3.p1 TRINITY_DN8503_c0_g1~~TRINITY_DN8503_c0_g1_i3.p1  ORF type:complete len:269 (-),score=40.23 TRINITY_DN8503_c0_g1_i3:342-1148(-)
MASVMFDSRRLWNQHSSDPSRRKHEFLGPIPSISGSTMWIDRNVGNDFGDSPRDALFEKLDGIQGQEAGFSFVDKTDVDIGDAVCFLGKGCTVDCGGVSNMISLKNGQLTKRKRRAAARASAVASSGLSHGLSASQILETMEMLDALVLAPANAEEVKEGEQPVSWPKTATAAMLRNIPNRYSAEELLAEIKEAGFEGQIDVFYKPTDFSANGNRAVAVVHFNTSGVASGFAACFNGKRLSRYQTQETLHVTPATSKVSTERLAAALS